MVWWVGAAIAVGTQVIGGTRAKRQAEKDEKRSQRLLQKEIAEGTRRMQTEQAYVRGTAQATIGASGVVTGRGGTADTYLEELEAEQQRELDWYQKTGQSRAAELSATESALRRQQNMQMIGAVGQGFSDIYSGGQQQGMWG